MPTELYNRNGHRCLMFSDLGEDGGEAVQSNQFLIVDGDTGAIIDPGGNLAYNELYVGMTKHFPPSKLSALLASHADPDIIAALDRWTTATPATLYISTLWARFAPHFCKPGKTTGRIVGIPDAGMRIAVGRSELWADMVSRLKIDMIVPQHGAPLVGAAVGQFIAWARELKCGIDLMGAREYTLPA